MRLSLACSVLVPCLMGGPIMGQILPADHTPSLGLASPAFATGAAIPARYTCDGADESPPLRWNKPPDNARSLVLIVDDPDAPGKTFNHWVLFNLPPALNQLRSNVPPGEKTAQGGAQGRNDFGTLGYGGPCPPQGSHRYFFHLYALDLRLELDSAATESDVMEAMSGHILARGELMGTYRRN
jgi:Raf kinase inhibitor-like YbhB/YbcL family protein